MGFNIKLGAALSHRLLRNRWRCAAAHLLSYPGDGHRRYKIFSNIADWVSFGSAGISSPYVVFFISISVPRLYILPAVAVRSSHLFFFRKLVQFDICIPLIRPDNKAAVQNRYLLPRGISAAARHRRGLAPSCQQASSRESFLSLDRCWLQGLLL